MGEAVLREIVDTVSRLPEDGQSQVLAYAKALIPTPEVRKPLKDWREIVGILSHEEAEELQRVIDEGCRQVDPREW